MENQNISETQSNNNLKAVIESLLFVSGEPLAISKLASLAGVGQEELRQAVEELKGDYENPSRGLRLMENNGELALVTSPLVCDYVSKLIKLDLEGDLSQAAAETLAIIAYKGPMARLSIDEIRGVNSSYILRALTLRGLVDREHNPKRMNSFIYKISNDCLKFLGISDIGQLPDYQKLNSSAAPITEEQNDIQASAGN